MPICTALAPSVSAAATPRPSAMPPVATTGTDEPVGEPRQQGEQADGLALGRGGVEGAAMAAGLDALGDDHVGAGRLGRPRLGDRGGAGEPGDAARLQLARRRPAGTGP